MTKKFILFILINLIFIGLKSQNTGRPWSNGKLTWNDFKDTSSTSYASYFAYNFGYNIQRTKLNDTLVIRNMAYSNMDTNQSWINIDYKNNQYLRYNQVIFDITEKYRRKLQEDIVNSGEFIPDYIIKKDITSLRSEIYSCYKQTEGGQRLDVLTKWERNLSDELDKNYSDAIPPHRLTNFGMGMNAGLGSGFYTDSLGKYISPTFNLTYGFDIAYKQHYLFLQATLAWGTFLKDNFMNSGWLKNQTVNIAILDISYGYAFINSPKFKLTPFVGLGIIGFTEQIDTNNSGYGGFKLIYGLNSELKLGKTLSFIASPYEYNEMSLRARLYVTNANFGNNMKGYSINLTLGINGFSRFIKILGKK